MRSRRYQRQRLSRQAKLRFAESMHAQTAVIENGFVHVPDTAPRLVQYSHELTELPERPLRRPVDSPAQMLDRHKRGPGPVSDDGVFELYR
jgi:hypothetical protein